MLPLVFKMVWLAYVHGMLQALRHWENALDSTNALARTRNARLATAMLIFCCHKCHTGNKDCWAKSAESAENDSVENVYFSVLQSKFGAWTLWFVEIYLKTMLISWNVAYYKEGSDTCDSKNDKTPCNARVRARARGCFYVFWQSNFQSLVLASFNLDSTSELEPKVSRRFVENDTLFYRKRYVVLWKVSRSFVQSIPFFSWDDRLAEKRKTHRLRYVFKIYIFTFVFRENFSIRSSVLAGMLLSTRLLLLMSLFTTLRLTLSALLKALFLFWEFDAYQWEKKSKRVFE